MSSDSDSESDAVQPRSPPPNGRMPTKTKAKPSKKIIQQQPTPPDAGLVKKSGVKEMVISALRDLHSRKGVSLYAIKKYIENKYEVKAEKINYYIKKQIKNGLEEGTITQTTGAGASGSFKLNPVAKEKKKIKKKEEKPKEKKKEPKQTKGEKAEPKLVKTKKKNAEKTTKKTAMLNATPTKKKKAAKTAKTPITKKSMARRKSIGSIIKKPKMKPKSIAVV